MKECNQKSKVELAMFENGMLGRALPSMLIRTSIYTHCKARSDMFSEENGDLYILMNNAHLSREINVIRVLSSSYARMFSLMRCNRQRV